MTRIGQATQIELLERLVEQSPAVAQRIASTLTEGPPYFPYELMSEVGLALRRLLLNGQEADEREARDVLELLAKAWRADRDNALGTHDLIGLEVVEPLEAEEPHGRRLVSELLPEAISTTTNNQQ